MPSCHGPSARDASMPARGRRALEATWLGLGLGLGSVRQSVSHYHTPSRELTAHTLALLTRVRVRRVSLDQGLGVGFGDLEATRLELGLGLGLGLGDLEAT
eukprot:scaffold90561_cov42-Phaeocystis_antarctica.AAC.1